MSNRPTEPNIICNCCGLTCVLEPGQMGGGNHGLINAVVVGGYASTPGNGSGALDDGTYYQFSMCEFCLDWLFTRFIVPPHVSDHGDKEMFRPAPIRVTEDDWRQRMRKEFFEEYEKRNKARNEFGSDTEFTGFSSLK